MTWNTFYGRAVHLNVWIGTPDEIRGGGARRGEEQWGEDVVVWPLRLVLETRRLTERQSIIYKTSGVYFNISLIAFSIRIILFFFMAIIKMFHISNVNTDLCTDLSVEDGQISISVFFFFIWRLTLFIWFVFFFCLFACEIIQIMGWRYVLIIG